jgi:tetratricopeptide (TPR) repeat protein
MSQISCKYHPDSPARWVCSTCSINYCKSCVSEEDTGRGVFCPVCKNKLHPVSSSNAIKPFWIISGKFFAYPLHLHPLGFLIVLTILYAQFDPTLMGKLMHFVISIVFMKYTYAVLEDTAHGHLKPLPINGKVINDELDLPFKQILLTLIISAINIYILIHFGYAAVSVSVVLTSVAFPAVIMVLALKHSFFSALNPILIVNVIKRIGAAYFLLALLLLLLLSASATVMNVLYSSVSYNSYILISSFVNMYFALIMFHLMGYVLYQYHTELGFDIAVRADDIKIKSSDEPVINSQLRGVEILVQEGKVQEANARLALMINENPANNDFQMYNLKLQHLLGDMDAYNKHAKKYISYLFASQQIPHAIKILPIILTSSPSFKPAQATERFELAKLLKQNGRSKAAVMLINKLHTDFPSFKEIPEAYFMASKILCEQLGNDMQAISILNFLLLKFPEHALRGEIETYLGLIKTLNKKTNPLK